MKKFLAFLFSALFIAANAAPAQSMIPASATVAAVLNSEQLLNWPLFQQMAGPQLQAGLTKAQLTAQDIQGTIAIGVTFAKVQPKENLRFDAIINFKNPVAAKLFAALESELAINPNMVKSNEKGKICLSADNFKVVLLSQNELTCQGILGNKLKFAKLGKSKNIFSKIKLPRGTATIVFDFNRLGKFFAEHIPAELKPMVDNKLYSGITVDLLPDGSLKYSSLDTFKTAAACKEALALTNAQLIEAKANPALAAIVDKVKIETVSPTAVRTSSELSATDVQMAASSLMMLAMAQAQKSAAAAAPAVQTAPETPVK